MLEVRNGSWKSQEFISQSLMIPHSDAVEHVSIRCDQSTCLFPIYMLQV